MNRPAGVQLALFGPVPVHLFRWDASAVHVPPLGNPVGEKLRFGDWQCVICRVSLSFAVVWDDCGSCPGYAEPAPAGMTLGDALAMHEPAEAGLPLVEAA